MEKCLEKIKNEIELKRKHNEETLRLLKQKSILYNAQKEKQKNFFLSRASTFLGKKRKLSNDSDDIKNNDNEISNDLNNYTDYDEYIDDFMNSSFMSTRTFTNLNFCRPERFSYKNKKKKFLIKSEEKFTINKTIKPKEIKKSEISSFTLANSTKKNDNIQSGFAPGFMSKGIVNENKTEDLFDIKDKDNNKTGVLFGSDFTNISNNDISSNKSKDNINSKSLFTSNIKDEDKKEEKEIDKSDNKASDNEEKKGGGLFGNIDRIKDNEENKPVLFGSKENKSPEKNQKIPEKIENLQKTSLFNFGANDKDTEKEEKNKNSENKSLFSSTSSNNLFGDQFKNQEEKAESNKDDIKKESENKEAAKSLFGEKLFKFSEKEEEKEKLNLSNIKELKEKEDTKESEKKSEPKEKISLFGNITEKPKEKSEKTFSLFGNIQTGNNINSNAEQEKKAELPILNEKKDDDKQKQNFGLFNTINSDNKITNIFSSNENINQLGAKNDEEKNKNNIKENNPINDNNNEDKNLKDIINNGKGTLVNNNNPFLNPEKHNPLPDYFSVKNLTPKKINDSNNTNASSIFNSLSNANNNIFIANNQNKPFFFEANATSTNRMDMSPQQKGRSLFINNPPGNNSLFGIGNSGNSQFNNIFNNNPNSLFNNNNSGFAGGSGNLFTNQNNGFFSSNGNNNAFSLGFSMGKK